MIVDLLSSAEFGGKQLLLKSKTKQCRCEKRELGDRKEKSDQEEIEF